MGLDWRTLDLSSYLEAFEAHQAAHSGEKGSAPVTEESRERLAAVMAARMGP